MKFLTKNSSTTFNLYIIIIILGNALDHYDTSISSFLVPVIGKCFFPASNELITMIKGYSAIWSSLVGKILGIVFFHFFLNKYGTKNSIICALLGMSIATISMVFIPCNMGYTSGLLFIILRIMQSFFAIGEYLICSILLIQLIGNKSIASSYYHSSTMIGIIIASFVAYLINLYPQNWSYAFIFGSIVGFIGVILRYIKVETNYNITLSQDYNISNTIYKNIKLIITVSFMTSLSYFTYVFCFVFINGFISLSSSSIYNKVIQYDYIWMCFDAFLIFVFGKIFNKYSYKTITLNLLFMFLFLIPLAFILLHSEQFIQIILAKLIILALGVSYSVSLTCFTYNLCDNKYRYLILGVGVVVGHDLLGKSFTPVMLYLSKGYDVRMALIYPLCVVLINMLILRKDIAMLIFTWYNLGKINKIT